MCGGVSSTGVLLHGTRMNGTAFYKATKCNYQCTIIRV